MNKKIYKRFLKKKKKGGMFFYKKNNINESKIDMIKKFVKEIVVKTNWDAKYRNVTNYPSSGNKIYFLIKMNKHKVPIPVPISTQKKPSLVLIFGFGGFSTSWPFEFINFLKEKYTVYPIDVNGETIEQMAKNMKIEIMKKGLFKPHVLGYSMGGFVLQELARLQKTYNFQLGKLIFLNTTCKIDKNLNMDRLEQLFPTILKDGDDFELIKRKIIEKSIELVRKEIVFGSFVVPLIKNMSSLTYDQFKNEIIQHVFENKRGQNFIDKSKLEKMKKTIAIELFNDQEIQNLLKKPEILGNMMFPKKWISFNNATSEKISKKFIDETKMDINKKHLISIFNWFNDNNNCTKKKISNNSIIITGKFDNVIQPEESKNLIKILHEKEFEIINDTAHGLVFQDPKFVAKKIDEFLSK